MSRIFKIVIVALVILGLFWGSFSVLAKSEGEGPVLSKVEGKQGPPKEKEIKAEEPWFERIPGFESIFVILACLYFILDLRWLPRLAGRDKHSEGHS